MELRIPVTKGKDFVILDTKDIPEDVYVAIVAEGLKSFVNRGMSKITVKDLEGAELEAAKAAAMKKANENLEAIKTGQIRIAGAKKDKVSGAVNTEAMRLARLAVKAAMKAKGIKVSHVEASEITKAAKSLIQEDESYLVEAKANVEAANKKGDAIADAIANIPISAKKKAAAEKDAAKKKADKTLSAAKAGKPAKHRPQLNA